jgi:hypothetical protein
LSGKTDDAPVYTASPDLADALVVLASLITEVADKADALHVGKATEVCVRLARVAMQVRHLAERTRHPDANGDGGPNVYLSHPQ